MLAEGPLQDCKTKAIVTLWYSKAKCVQEFPFGRRWRANNSKPQDKPLYIHMSVCRSQCAGQCCQLLSKGHVGENTSATTNYICCCLYQPQTIKYHEEADGDGRGAIVPAPADNQDTTVFL
jgi:hypothetical protein